MLSSIRYSRADETHIFAVPEESLNDSEKLTERERDVAELAAKGLHNSEDAALYTEQANKLAEPVGEPVAVPDEEGGAAKSARTASVQKKARPSRSRPRRGPG